MDFGNISQTKCRSNRGSNKVYYMIFLSVLSLFSNVKLFKETSRYLDDVYVSR